MKKIAIITAGRHGDVANCTAVLTYRTELWDCSNIYWFTVDQYAEVLKNNPQIELVKYDVNRLLKHAKARRNLRTITSALVSKAKKLGFDQIYTPCGYMNKSMWAKDLILAPAMYFGLSNRNWRPLIYLTEDEIDKVKTLMSRHDGNKVMLETKYQSGQSFWVPHFTIRVIQIARKYGFKILMASRDSLSTIPQDLIGDDIISLDDLNIRELTEAYNYCNMFIGVSSGISCVTLATRCRVIPRLEIIRRRKMNWSTRMVGTQSFSRYARFLKSVEQTMVRITKNPNRADIAGYYIK